MLRQKNKSPCQSFIEDGTCAFFYPYYWVYDPPLLYADNGTLDLGTYGLLNLDKAIRTEILIKWVYPLVN